MSAKWLELKFRRRVVGEHVGFDVVDGSVLPNVVLGFVFRQRIGWRGVAFLPGAKVSVPGSSQAGTFATREAAAKAVDLRVAREPDREPSVPELAEQPRLVFGGRR